MRGYDFREGQQFPFTVPATEADDLKKMIIEAKRLLQEAINDR
jgi:hypothetical protein